MSDTQDTSNEMPKLPNTVQIGGIYKFNARFPKHLIGEENGNRKLYRKSLGTGNWKEAKRKLTQVAYEFELEKQRLEKLIEEKTKGAKVTSKAYSQLGEAEKKQVILEWFLAKEKDAERFRSEVQTSEDELWRRDRIEDSQHDFGSFNDPDEMPFSKWQAMARKLLEQANIAFSDADQDDLAHLIRSARIEIARRSVERLTGKSPSPTDSRFQALTGFTELPKPSQSGFTVADICERFPRRFADGRLKKSTVTGYEMPINLLKDYFGESKPLRSISFEDGASLIAFLGEIPANKKQRFPDMTFREAAKLANVSKTGRGLSPKRQLDLFITIQSILSYAVEIEWVNRSPFDSKALKGLLPPIKRKEHVAFTSDELRSLFTRPALTGVLGSKDSEGQSTEARLWLPLLCAFHGLRINEAASLLIEDVKCRDGIHFLSVREENDEGETIKSLKSDVSQREVPIHRQILESGFLDFVQNRRTQQSDPFLFCELKADLTTGNRAKNFSQWINRQIKQVATNGPKKKEKTFHTFRHQVTDELRRITDSDDKRTALLGWTSGGGKKNAGADYGKGFPLIQLKELVDQITIQGLEDSPWR